MNDGTDDWALLRRYAESGCEEAFATLVARHIHYAYSVARRECGTAHQADEVTQAAFIILARKAGSLAPGTILSGWLFRTIRFVARNARRAEHRRRLHEEEVAHMSAHEPDGESNWEQIAPLLNDALAALNRTDRDTITLRFFEKKSHAEIATALRTNEPAARKRLSRAIDRLRHMLARRGVVVPAATLGTLLTFHAVEAAPLSLISGVTAAAAAASSPTSALVATTLQLMAWSKLKIAGAAAMILLVGGGASVMVVSASRKAEVPLSRTLPDGSIFSITQVEMAPRAEFRFPERPRKNAGGRTSGSISLVSLDAPETLFVGTTQEGGNGTVDVGRLQVISDDGSVFDGIFNGGTLSASEGHLRAWRVYAFPRRGRSLTLRFFYPHPRGEWVKATEMTVPNPASGPFEEWAPRGLPVAQTNEDLVVKLVEFDAGGSQPRHRIGVSSFWKRLPGTHCAFTLHQTGQAVAPWNVRSLQLSDATGNRWKQSSMVCWVGNEPEPRLHTSMPGALWASEPAWDLRVELTRTNDFRADELLAVPNIPVPQRDEVIELRDVHRVNGVDIEVRAIAGADAELPQPHKWLKAKGKMNLALTIHDGMGDKRLSLVSVRDDRGRSVAVADQQDIYARRDWVFSLDALPDAQTLEFTFAVHESRFLEFRARPEQIASTLTQQ
jgi:RNA polymerase sigma factor (sigma-70 family)